MRGRRSFQKSHASNVRPTPIALALVIALGAGAPRAAEAQQAAPAEAPAGGPLQEIVVTATRHEESLSKVPISVTALTQESLDLRGIKDFQDVAKFTPGVNIDNTGTNNISIRGIASTGGAGTTGIYIDDTPIQIRALAFNPDEALPKSFDIDRIEVLRGPQGTLFGAGSEGGTVRYITTQPSLTKSSIYSRSELSYTEGGEANYEAGVAAGGPVIDGILGVRASVWFRHDGGWIDRINPVTLATDEKNANYDRTVLVRLAAIWAPNDRWSITPGIYFQDRYRNDVENYWPLYSNPSQDRYVSGNPTQRSAPDRFYLSSLKIEGDLGSARLISNTAYYHRQDVTGYDGTLYNLGFYQGSANFALPNPFLDGTGIHLPPAIADYRAPASVQNGQMNFAEEIRLQSSDSNAPLIWTTGVFYSSNRQSYLEQIYDPKLNSFLATAYALTGLTPPASGDYITDWFGIGYDAGYPGDSYFLKTDAKDEQLAVFGETTWSATDALKLTGGLRLSKTKFSFTTATGGPQLYGPNAYGNGDQNENSFTPKLSAAYQIDPRNMAYATYAKGFRPGGANNPVPYAACATDFQNFGIPGAPQTFKSDTVDSYEIGAKNNVNNRLKLASSVYYIKWNNIQQTVIPPICQISWIQNLGQAVAKGADVQADIAFTDSLTMQLAAGYTSARYTQTDQFNEVTSGDAITGHSGQPASPFTGSVGLEYRFTTFDQEAFIRADYEYSGAPKWPSPIEDPNSLQYDSANFALKPTNYVTLRTGLSFGAWQIALFVDNLTDSHTLTGYDWSIDNGAGASRLMRGYTFRPRTTGFTFTYRN
jgi:outer membrane receptor protein involved in Fe transport